PPRPGLRPRRRRVLVDGGGGRSGRGRAGRGDMALNLDDVFRQTARRQPGHPAVLGPRPGDALTYRDLSAAIDGAAAALPAAGLRPGDSVGLHLPRAAAYEVYTYAVWPCCRCHY